MFWVLLRNKVTTLKIKILLPVLLFIVSKQGQSQHSVARIWNETQLTTIRQDFARPPVQARNLYHVSLAMYEAWAVYNSAASQYLLGNTLNFVPYAYNGYIPVEGSDTLASMNKAISYAAYRVLRHRYTNSALPAVAHARFDSVMNSLGYDIAITSTDYSLGPAQLGNYIGQQVIIFGYQDASNEVLNYASMDYTPSNTPMVVTNPSNINMTNLHRWQPLDIPGALDQNGNPIPSVQKHLNPEWGRVFPFALENTDATHYIRNGNDYPVYFDPGDVPQLNLAGVDDTMNQLFKWGHEMVSIWSSHLDPADTTKMDASPNFLGNGSYYPLSFIEQKEHFYKFFEGGDSTKGYPINPSTGLPYSPYLVNRADFLRVITQYWADGPTSETPPGHWYVLANEVSDHPDFVRKYEGVGDTISKLEWDVKKYFTLGGAMHDAAIGAWGVKGWYDSPRPISCIRKLCDLGQCSDSTKPNYNPLGIHLIPGYIEQIEVGDSLAGVMNSNVGKIKLKTWKGFSYISDPTQDIAGTGWIVGNRWMPYQRKTFVTPPFAGYVSGHSTYSRAGATVMALLTGDEFFPGGLSIHTVPQNSGFLVFEKGPLTDIQLQWATYRDASDQASLSRIWGGIHPPFDDMKGRYIGEQVGAKAHAKAKQLFAGSALPVHLASFYGVEHNCKVDLHWKTNKEKNVAEFEIWKSIDGIYFTKHASITAAGNSDLSRSYSYSDNQPEKYNYYQLFEKDINGRKMFLKQISVQALSCHGITNTIVHNLYPNPTETHYFLKIESVKDQTASVVLRDLSGRLVAKRDIQLFIGMNHFRDDLDHLKQGVYTLNVEVEGAIISSQRLSKY